MFSLNPKRTCATLLALALLVCTKLVMAAPITLAMDSEQGGLVVRAGQASLDAANQSYSFSGGLVVLGPGYTLSATRGDYSAERQLLTLSGDVRIQIEGQGLVSASYARLDGRSGGWEVRDFGLIFETGERVAAQRASSQDGESWRLENVAYTPCALCEDRQTPLWQLRARSAQLDASTQQIQMQDAQFVAGDRVLISVPYIQVANPEAGRVQGWLPPYLEYSSDSGLAIGASYFWPHGTDRDTTLTTILHFEDPIPDAISLRLRYRQAFAAGWLETEGQISLIGPDSGGLPTASTELGHGWHLGGAATFAGAYAFNSQWSVDADWLFFDQAGYADAFQFYNPDERLNSMRLNWDDGRSSAGLSYLEDWDLGDAPQLDLRFRPLIEADLYADDAWGGVWNLQARARDVTSADLLARDQQDADLRLSHAQTWSNRALLAESWVAGSAGLSRDALSASGERNALSTSLHLRASQGAVRPWMTLGGSEAERGDLEALDLEDPAPILSASRLASAQALRGGLDRAPLPRGFAAVGLEVSRGLSHSTLAVARMVSDPDYAPASSGFATGAYLLGDTLWSDDTGRYFSGQFQADEVDGLRHANLAWGRSIDTLHYWGLALDYTNQVEEQTRLGATWGGVLNADWRGDFSFSTDLERANHFTLTAELDYLFDCVGFEVDMRYERDGDSEEARLEVRMGLESLGAFRLGSFSF